MGAGKGYYLYALFVEKEPQDFGAIGIVGREKVFTLHYKDLALAVSRAPLKKYDPVRKSAMAHQKVISTIMERYDVLPVSFGTCVQSKQEIMDIFADLYDKAQSALEGIRNKIEVGLRVVWKKEFFVQELGVANRQIEALKKKIAERRGAANTYRQVLEIGEKIQAIADERRRHYVRLIFDPLCKMADDAILKDVTSERMVINATFLVGKSREKEFDSAVNDIYSQFSEMMDFKYTGPWPPYSFVNIKITGNE